MVSTTFWAAAGLSLAMYSSAAAMLRKARAVISSCFFALMSRLVKPRPEFCFAIYATSLFVSHPGFDLFGKPFFVIELILDRLLDDCIRGAPRSCCDFFQTLDKRLRQCNGVVHSVPSPAFRRLRFYAKK